MKINLLFLSMSTIFITLCGIENHESRADTIILKSGRKVVVDMAWEEGNTIKGTRSAVTIGFPKDEVENVIYEKSEQKDTDSFQFDIWNGGISINEAVKIAERHNLPLMRIGVVSTATKFDPSISKFIKSENKFYYNTKLMGKHAAITLCFTPSSRLLYQIEVSLAGGNDLQRNSAYQAEIEEMLSKKYGKSIKSTYKLLWDRYSWDVDGKYLVTMQVGMSAIDISYMDKQLDSKNTAESNLIKDKEKASYTEKDSSKF
jgi:hypothetical protein